jgi:hypothetical protein
VARRQVYNYYRACVATPERMRRPSQPPCAPSKTKKGCDAPTRQVSRAKRALNFDA